MIHKKNFGMYNNEVRPQSNNNTDKNMYMYNKNSISSTHMYNNITS
jgi:hypothetical protein